MSADMVGQVDLRCQIAAMMKDGWQFAGPVHANGINCSMNLFVR
jgi:hypothetical protein